MDSGLPSLAACSLPVQDMQICHFHLRVDCCWDPLTLCLGGSNRAQLMRRISGHVVTCILVKCSITGFILMPGADFQEMCYFFAVDVMTLLQNSRDLSYGFPTGVCNKQHISSFSAPNISDNKAPTEHMTQVAGLLALQSGAATKLFHALIPSQSWLNSVSPGMWAGAVFVGMEYVAFRTQRKLRRGKNFFVERLQDAAICFLLWRGDPSMSLTTGFLKVLLKY